MYRQETTSSRFWTAGFAAVLLLSGVLTGTDARAGQASNGRALDSYEFHLKPGTASWAELSSHEEMLEATQIPQGILKKMSTQGLVETALNYPLYLDMLAYDDPQVGFQRVAERFNGLKALLERPDAGTELLARYKAFDPTITEGWALEQQGAHAARLMYLEMMLSQESIREKLTAEEQLQLAVEKEVKNKVKQQYSEVYGKPADNPDTEDYWTTVSTPNGSTVWVIATTYELSSAEIANANNYVATAYPRAVRETNASRRYNCHSYAWYSQSIYNTAWMNAPYQKTYWQDYSYSRVYSPYVSSRVNYYYDDHSAIVAGSGVFRSKWGQLPRMLHAPSYSPYNASYFEYYYR